MKKRLLSTIFALTLLLSLTVTAFAAELELKSVTTFNGAISIDNITKTGDYIADADFDQAKTDLALEVSDEHHSIEDNTELYFCSGAPVTVSFNQTDDGNYGISGYICYYLDIPSEPIFAISEYDTEVYSPEDDDYVDGRAFTGTITLHKPGVYYIYATNRSLISSDCDIGVYIVVGDGAASTTEVTPAPEATPTPTPAPTPAPEASTPAPTPTVTYFAKSTYAGPSIVDALKSVKVDSSLRYRAVIAAANGISGYRGSAEQNIRLLTLFKQGKLIKP